MTVFQDWAFKEAMRLKRGCRGGPGTPSQLPLCEEESRTQRGGGDARPRAGAGLQGARSCPADRWGPARAAPADGDSPPASAGTAASLTAGGSTLPPSPALRRRALPGACVRAVVVGQPCASFTKRRQRLSPSTAPTRPPACTAYAPRSRRASRGRGALCPRVPTAPSSPWHRASRRSRHM